MGVVGAAALNAPHTLHHAKAAEPHLATHLAAGRHPAARTAKLAAKPAAGEAASHRAARKETPAGQQVR